MARRLVLAAAGWALAVAVLAVSGLWRPIDHWIFGHLFLREPPALFDGAALVDVPHDRSVVEEHRFRMHRERVAAVLLDLAGWIERGGTAPAAVVLDIAFLKPADEGIDAVLAALARLRRVAPGCAVFGAVMPWKESAPEPDPGYALRHVAEIYDRLDGTGHTVFAQHGRLLLYAGSIRLAAAGRGAEVRLPALPIVIARRLFRLAPDAEPDTVLVPLGTGGSPPVVKARFEGETARLARAADWREAGAASILIVGDLARDVENPYRRPGPELFAWALSDLATHSRDRSVREPLNRPGFAAMEILAAALLVAAFFTLALRWRLARVDPERADRALWVLGLGAWGAATVTLAVAAAAFLLADRVIPLALPFIGAGLAAVACVLVADRWLSQVIGDAHRFMRAFPQRFRYDVFVSYSRESANAAWVERHVVEPLRAARNARGEPLEVFFDRSEIAVGERWEDRILSSLAASRVFMPVYSTDYFDKPYCRLESELASLLQKAQRGPVAVLPVWRGGPVPDAYQAVQYVDASRDEAFMERLMPAVTAAVAR